MSPDHVDAEQATLETFDEPSVRDDDRDDHAGDVADGVDAEAVLEPDHLDKLGKRLVALEAVVPGVEPVTETMTADWESLGASEKEALLTVRLAELKRHVVDALPDEEPSSADIGFE